MEVYTTCITQNLYYFSLHMFTYVYICLVYIFPKTDLGFGGISRLKNNWLRRCKGYKIANLQMYNVEK